MLDPNGQMEAGQQYTHHFSVTSVGTWSPASIADALSGDSNFSGVSANLTHAGVFTSTVDVTFTYAGQGSNVGQNGQEAAQVINDHFSFSAFSWTGTDSGVTAAPPDDQSNTALYVLIGILVIAGLFVVTRLIGEVEG